MALSKQIIRSIRLKQEAGMSEEVREKIALHICDTLAISLAAY